MSLGFHRLGVVVAAAIMAWWGSQVWLASERFTEFLRHAPDAAPNPWWHDWMLLSLGLPAAAAGYVIVRVFGWVGDGFRQR